MWTLDFRLPHLFADIICKLDNFVASAFFVEIFNFDIICFCYYRWSEPSAELTSSC